VGVSAAQSKFHAPFDILCGPALGAILSHGLQRASEGTVRIFSAGHNVAFVEMRVHVDKGRPDVTRFQINGWQVGGCRPACRINRSDPVLVDEQVDQCRAVTINILLRSDG